MTPRPLPIALLYDDSAYSETLQPVHTASGEQPRRLVGRQVAGHEFLDAYLSYGEYDQMIGAVWNQASADSLVQRCRRHPRAGGRAPRLVEVDRFLERGLPPAAPILYTPCPPDASFAWMRHERGPGSFALAGVTHTLATAGAVRLLNDLITAPFEPYDALICTSAAVMRMVRAVTGAYVDYLASRFGGAPRLRMRLAHVPLGVNPERFRPATAAERTARRAALNIHPDAVAVLFVGRFTPHAKAHPFPMLHGLARAAQSTRRSVHLILSGWAAGETQLQWYLDGVRAFAPGIPVSVVNGLDPDLRFGVWHAADVCTSLADSVQETFGLVPVEAMACGLPVVATDWDGYRDLVVDGETGFLVPSAMVDGATAEASLRLLLGAIDYDAFLAECNQAVAVDGDAAAAAYAHLLVDGDLRRRQGAAGRERVLQHFTWQRVVQAYEQLWREQDQERQAHMCNVGSVPPVLGPPCYPAPEVSFAGYPTLLLRDNDRLVCAADALPQLSRVLALPLCMYAGQRVTDEATLRAVLEAAAVPCASGDLADLLTKRGVRPAPARATLAWLLKYRLLQRSAR
jgi:glycosyltransferase involved in cell wall biosynthesis